MVVRLRLMAAVAALVSAVVVGFVIAPATPDPLQEAVQLRSTDAPIPPPTPVINITDPDPFDPCRDIPYDVVAALGLAYTPPDPEDSLRCHYDAGNYQMAVEAIMWRTYEKSLPKDAIELDIDGHRAAWYWIMKPTDWNDRWWITCMVAFKTSYGLIQQSLFYSPIYSPNGPDCVQENLMRAHQLAPHYIF